MSSVSIPPRLISDELWALAEPFIPPQKPAVHGRTGRPPVSDRDVHFVSVRAAGSAAPRRARHSGGRGLPHGLPGWPGLRAVAWGDVPPGGGTWSGSRELLQVRSEER